jgi:hypothetical protein
MTMGNKELTKEIDWLLEKIELSLDEWKNDSFINHSHSPDGNFVMVDAGVVNNNLISRLDFLKEQLELMKHKIEEPPKD